MRADERSGQGLRIALFAAALLASHRPAHGQGGRPEFRTQWIKPVPLTYNSPWGVLSVDRSRDTPFYGWTDTNTLSGDWGGVRSDLRRNYGITLFGWYVMQSAGNVVGGERRGATYAHDIYMELNADLAALGLPNTYFIVSASDRAGTSLAHRYIGNVFDPQQIAAGETFRLAQLALAKRWLDGEFELALGRINALDDFFVSTRFCVAQSAAFCGNPFSLTANVSISSYPFASWGARFRWIPSEAVAVTVGAYNAFANFRANGYHGTDFSIRSDSGVIGIGEVRLRPDLLSGATVLADLPGWVKLGGYFDNEPLTVFRTGESERGTWSAYLALYQKLYNEADAAQGLSTFAGLNYAPPDVNSFTWFTMAGLIYQGLLPARDADTTGLFFAYGQFSDDLHDSQVAAGAAGQTYEAVLELNYAFDLLPWLTLQPDIQGILHPGAAGGIPDALVVGLQATIPF